MVMQCSVEDFGSGQTRLSAPQETLETLFSPVEPEATGAEESLASAIAAEPEEPWDDTALAQAKRRRDEEDDDLEDDDDDDEDEEDDFEDDDVGGAYDDDDLDDEDEDIFYDEDDDD